MTVRAPRRLVAAFLAVAALLALTALPASARPTGTEVSFRGRGGITLHGTVLPGAGPGRHPGIVLVSGSGEGNREDYREEAAAFARDGITTLIYDKRTAGYSALHRDFSVLADDALGAVRALRARPGVDPARVGLWGRSEGGWVAPIAAASSADVAFLILIGANSVPPARQQAWRYGNWLRHAGVRGSMLTAAPVTGTSLAVGAGMFAEADHDPVPVLRRVRQPVLALWGARDTDTPPAESARIMRQALTAGGNRHYALRFVPGADHELRQSPDGFTQLDRLAPGYVDTLTAFVREGGSGTHVDPFPRQQAPSQPITAPPWYASAPVQAVVLLACLVVFAGFLLGAAFSRRRRWRATSRWLAATGLVATVGLPCYLAYLTVTKMKTVGPVVLGRPVPWLALQALAVATVVLTVGVAVTAWRHRAELPAAGRVRVPALLVSGVLFTVVAAYWRLLVP